MLNEKKMIQLAHVEKAHGIKGGLDLYVYNDESLVLKNLKKVWLTPRKHAHKTSQLPLAGKAFDIDKMTLGHKNILYLKEITSLTEAEKIIPFDLMVESSLLPALKDDEVYIKDLFGLNVINFQNEHIGEIHEVYDNGAQLILVVKKTSGELVDVPYVDEFVIEVLVNKNEIKINMPDWNFT